MIHVLSGENQFMALARKRELVNEFIKQHGDMAMELIDCSESDVNSISGALESMPFLSNKKMVVLDKPSSQKQVSEALPEMLKTVPESTDVIVLEPKFDKRSVYYKSLKKLPGFEDFAALDRPKMIAWMKRYAEAQDASIDADAASELYMRAGQDQLKVARELDKLSLYDSNISVAAVQELTVSAPSSTIFELIEAAFSGNKKQALALYEEQRALLVDPIQIVALLAWQFQMLALLKTAGDRSPQAIASEAKVSPYVLQKSSGIAQRLSKERVSELVHELRMIDERMKSTRLNADDALKAFIVTI